MRTIFVDWFCEDSNQGAVCINSYNLKDELESSARWIVGISTGNGASLAPTIMSQCPLQLQCHMSSPLHSSVTCPALLHSSVTCPALFSSSVTCPALFTPVSHVQPSSLQCHMSSPPHSSVTCPALFTPVSHVQPSSTNKAYNGVDTSGRASTPRSGDRPVIYWP